MEKEQLAATENDNIQLSIPVLSKELPNKYYAINRNHRINDANGAYKRRTELMQNIFDHLDQNILQQAIVAPTFQSLWNSASSYVQKHFREESDDFTGNWLSSDEITRLIDSDTITDPWNKIYGIYSHHPAHGRVL